MNQITVLFRVLSKLFSSKAFFAAMLIGTIFLQSCRMNNKERFFTKEEYENESNQQATADILDRIKNDPSTIEDTMVFSFYFITDERIKIDSLIDYLEANEKNQPVIELNKRNDFWELNGRTYPIKLDINSMLNWERKMWDIGYKFDCRLDYWTTTSCFD